MYLICCRVSLASYEIAMRQKEAEELRCRPSISERENKIKSKINADLRLAQGQVEHVKRERDGFACSR